MKRPIRARSQVATYKKAKVKQDWEQHGRYCGGVWGFTIWKRYLKLGWINRAFLPRDRWFSKIWGIETLATADFEYEIISSFDVLDMKVLNERSWWFTHRSRLRFIQIYSSKTEMFPMHKGISKWLVCFLSERHHGSHEISYARVSKFLNKHMPFSLKTITLLYNL